MKQYFVRYQFDQIESSRIFKSDISPIEFFDDLKMQISTKHLISKQYVKILNISCLGDFQTEEEKKIEKEEIRKMFQDKSWR